MFTWETPFLWLTNNFKNHWFYCGDSKFQTVDDLNWRGENQSIDYANINKKRDFLCQVASSGDHLDNTEKRDYLKLAVKINEICKTSRQIKICSCWLSVLRFEQKTKNLTIAKGVRGHTNIFAFVNSTPLPESVTEMIE